VFDFGAKRARRSAKAPARPSRSQLDLRAPFPSAQVNAAFDHLLSLLLRAAGLIGETPTLRRRLTRIRTEARHATLAEDYESLSLDLAAIDVRELVTARDEEDGRQHARIQRGFEAAIPLARALQLEAVVVALQRLSQDAADGQVDDGAQFEVQLERLTEGARWAHGMTQTFRSTVIELVESLGRLPTSQSLGLDRLTRIRGDLQAAREIGELQKLRAVLLAETERLVEGVAAQAADSDRVQRQVSAARQQIESLESALADANRDAFTDALTGLSNRRALQDVLQGLARSGRTTALLYIDADYFKRINDRHGHELGDMALRKIAFAMRGVLEPGDHAFRLGGEEFLILLGDASSAEALKRAEDLRIDVEASPVDHKGERVPFTVSIGIAQWRASESFADALAQADSCLYEAKRAGRNRTVMVRGS